MESTGLRRALNGSGAQQFNRGIGWGWPFAPQVTVAASFRVIPTLRSHSA